MSIVHGAVLATVAAAVTLLIVSLAGLGLVVMWISEERVGMGCQSAGCRRSRGRNGLTGARGAEPPRGHITEKE